MISILQDLEFHERLRNRIPVSNSVFSYAFDHIFVCWTVRQYTEVYLSERALLQLVSDYELAQLPVHILRVGSKNKLRLSFLINCPVRLLLILQEAQNSRALFFVLTLDQLAFFLRISGVAMVSPM